MQNKIKEAKKRLEEKPHIPPEAMLKILKEAKGKMDSKSEELVSIPFYPDRLFSLSLINAAIEKLEVYNHKIKIADCSQIAKFFKALVGYDSYLNYLKNLTFAGKVQIDEFTYCVEYLHKHGLLEIYAMDFMREIANPRELQVSCGLLRENFQASNITYLFHIFSIIDRWQYPLSAPFSLRLKKMHFTEETLKKLFKESPPYWGCFLQVIFNLEKRQLLDQQLFLTVMDIDIRFFDKIYLSLLWLEGNAKENKPDLINRFTFISIINPKLLKLQTTQCLAQSFRQISKMDDAHLLRLVEDHAISLPALNEKNKHALYMVFAAYNVLPYLFTRRPKVTQEGINFWSAATLKKIIGLGPNIEIFMLLFNNIPEIARKDLFNFVIDALTIKDQTVPPFYHALVKVINAAQHEDNPVVPITKLFFDNNKWKCSNIDILIGFARQAGLMTTERIKASLEIVLQTAEFVTPFVLDALIFLCHRTVLTQRVFNQVLTLASETAQKEMTVEEVEAELYKNICKIIRQASEITTHAQHDGFTKFLSKWSEFAPKPAKVVKSSDQTATNSKPEKGNAGMSLFLPKMSLPIPSPKEEKENKTSPKEERKKKKEKKEKSSVSKEPGVKSGTLSDHLQVDPQQEMSTLYERIKRIHSQVQEALNQVGSTFAVDKNEISKQSDAILSEAKSISDSAEKQ